MPRLPVSDEPISRTPTATVGRPVLRMRWQQLTYVHWAVDPAVVAARLPAGLRPDTFDGRAYVGLVPFKMAGIGLGPRGVPLPQGTFPESNVRTYVVGPDGGRGVYFHSLDVPRLAPTLVARATYRLPYCWSRMRISRRGDRIGYLARRRWPGPLGAASRLVVEVGRELAPDETTPLDDFLTARWSLLRGRARGRGTAREGRSRSLVPADRFGPRARGRSRDGRRVRPRRSGPRPRPLRRCRRGPGRTPPEDRLTRSRGRVGTQRELRGGGGPGRTDRTCGRRPTMCRGPSLARHPGRIPGSPH